MNAPRRLPSRLMANLYLVIGIAVLVFAGRSETDPLARYGIGIIVEISLAVTALLFMRLEGLSILQTARLHLPERRTILLTLAALPGLWITGVGLNLLSTLILGYTAPATPSQFPANALEAIALALTTVVVAPICEELMFRGYVQRAYERHHAWVGVVVGGLIFALYHLRFQGVFSLVPVALALGFVAWRTGSIFPGMALHSAFNAIATVLLIATSFAPATVVGGLTIMALCLAALLTPLSFAALWLLWKTTEPVPTPPTEARAPALFRWAWAIPLLALAAVYAYAAGSEVLVSRFPQTVLHDDLNLDVPTSWQQPVRWTYSIQDPLGREIGRAQCARAVQDEMVSLSCDADHAGFDLTTEVPGLSQRLQGLPLGSLNLPLSLQAEPTKWTLSTLWTEPALGLSALTARRTTEGSDSVEMTYPAPDGSPDLVVQVGTQEPSLVTVPATRTLMSYEWAWRAAALPFQIPYGGPIPVAQANEQGEVQVADGFLRIKTGEPTWTPNKTYVTWKVVLVWDDADGQSREQTAWYDARMPHDLVRYDDGTVSYLLDKIEAGTP